MNTFCCHNSSDKDIVGPIASALKEAGHEVFFDEWSLVPGDSLIEKIPDALSRPGVFILFLSAASNESTWCKRELAMAVTQLLNSKDIRVIAFRLEKMDPPLIIADLLNIDAVCLGLDQALEKLLWAVDGRAAPTTTEPYSDVSIDIIKNPGIPTTSPLPSEHCIGLLVRAKRFSHPRFYIRVTTTAPLRTEIIREVPGFDGMRTMIASAAKGNVFEHTEGPPGLEPDFPWFLAIFADRPFEIQEIHVEEANPFMAVSNRAEGKIA